MSTSFFCFHSYYEITNYNIYIKAMQNKNKTVYTKCLYINIICILYPRQEPTPAPRRPAPAVLPVPSQPQWGSPEHNWDRPPPTAIGVSTRAARVDPAPGALPARVQPQWRPPRAQLGCPPPLRHDRSLHPRRERTRGGVNPGGAGGDSDRWGWDGFES